MTHKRKRLPSIRQTKSKNVQHRLRLKRGRKKASEKFNPLDDENCDLEDLHHESGIEASGVKDENSIVLTNEEIIAETELSKLCEPNTIISVDNHSSLLPEKGNETLSITVNAPTSNDVTFQFMTNSVFSVSENEKTGKIVSEDIRGP